MLPSEQSGADDGMVFCHCTKSCGGPGGSGKQVTVRTLQRHAHRDVALPSSAFSSFLASASGSSSLAAPGSSRQTAPSPPPAASAKRRRNNSRINVIEPPKRMRRGDSSDARGEGIDGGDAEDFSDRENSQVCYPNHYRNVRAISNIL